MKERNNENIALKNLFNIVNATMYSKILFAGIELDVFSELEESKCYLEISEKLNLHKENTKYLLDALTSLDFLVKTNGEYINSYSSSKFLVKSSDYYIGSLLKSKNDLDLDIVKRKIDLKGRRKNSE